MTPTSHQFLVCKNMKAYSIKKIINKKVTKLRQDGYLPLKNRYSPIFNIPRGQYTIFLSHN